ncbi:hypothetical protein M2427_007765 [Bradyrhizobium sp. BR13661]|jgi:hypothetical protein|nr:hypothetical protein [Bradyrhizobium sp. BR13661]
MNPYIRAGKHLAAPPPDVPSRRLCLLLQATLDDRNGNGNTTSLTDHTTTTSASPLANHSRSTTLRTSSSGAFV